jgi:hypothetical protein
MLESSSPVPARASQLIAWGLLALFAATSNAPHAETVEASANPSEVVCLHDGIEPSGTARLIEEAVAVLRQSGHEPTAYRLDLRMEDARSPDAPTRGAERVPSVVFLPATRADLYALRVHPVSPCVASWVWQPARFTPWQRAVLARAREQIERIRPAAPVLGDLQVHEAQKLVRIEFRDPTQRVSVTLSKQSLEVVDVVRESPGPAD